MAHSTDYYQTGGGILYIAEWDGSTPPEQQDYVDMGNCPELSIKPEIEMLPHKSSRGGRAKTDKKVGMEETLLINFKLDEVQEATLLMFFFGTKVGNKITILTATTKEYAVKFVPDYEAGEEWAPEIWRVSISPSEALNLINMGAWAEMGFTGEVLEDITNNPTEPFGEIVKQTD